MAQPVVTLLAKTPLRLEEPRGPDQLVRPRNLPVKAVMGAFKRTKTAKGAVKRRSTRQCSCGAAQALVQAPGVSPPQLADEQREQPSEAEANRTFLRATPRPACPSPFGCSGCALTLRLHLRCHARAPGPQLQPQPLPSWPPWRAEA